MTQRRHLPDERSALTHKFSVGEHEGYITVGLYEDGTPGEIFLTMSKEGSTISGLMGSFATAISLALQYGVPLEALVEKFRHTRFEPAGHTKNPEIPVASSLVDYIFRWLASRLLAPMAAALLLFLAFPGFAAEPTQKVVLGRCYEVTATYQDPNGAERLADVFRETYRDADGVERLTLASKLLGKESAVFVVDGVPELIVKMTGPPEAEACGGSWAFTAGLTTRALTIRIVAIQGPARGTTRVYAGCVGQAFPTTLDTRAW